MGWVYDAKHDNWILAPTYRNDVQYDFSIAEPDFSGIKTTDSRPYNPEYILYINNKLKSIPILQRSTILANIIEESGGNPFEVDDTNTYRGLLLWEADRYVPKSKDLYEELDNQIQYILDTYRNTTDRKSWNRNDDAYKNTLDAYNHFRIDNTVPTIPMTNLFGIHRAFTRGYVRPSGKEASVNNRYEVTKQIYDRIK